MRLGRLGRRIQRVLSGERVGTTPTAADVRDAARSVLDSTPGIERAGEQVTKDLVAGAIQASEESGGEAGESAKEAVKGVVSAASEVAPLADAAVIRDAVHGAMSSAQHGVDAAELGRKAAEGAIEAAADSGIDLGTAISHTSQGAVEAAAEAAADIPDSAQATVTGVLEGVEAVGGDVARAAEQVADELVSTAGALGEDVGDVARSVIDASVEYALGADAPEAASSAVAGAVTAAYRIDEATGRRIRAVAMAAIQRPRLTQLAESIAVRKGDFEIKVAAIAETTSKRLDNLHGGWRLRALWRAGTWLVQVGGIDLAASLAYFTLLSFVPMIALVVLMFGWFGDVEPVRDWVSELFLYYFPSSEDFLDQVLLRIFDAPLAVGFVSLIGLIIGANGLFIAANRAVNRVFQTRPRRMGGNLVSEFALVSLAFAVFLVSILLTFVFRFAVSIGEAVPVIGGEVGSLVLAVVEIATSVMPFAVTAILFASVYKRLPNTKVPWTNAAFGAMVAVVLFEASKHGFFWFGNLTATRDILYGPIASVVVLLLWSFVAGLIFLYGAAIVRQAGLLRPKGSQG